MKLIDVLKGLPVAVFQDYGPIIDFGSIVKACELYGKDNSQMVEVELKELEKQGLIKTVYNNTPGYEDLMIGIKLSSWN